MRKFIDIVTRIDEGVDFHPSVMRKEDQDGKLVTIIDYPPNTTRQETKSCPFCNGTGKNKYDPDEKCGYCYGEGTTLEWVYDFPSMRIPYMGIELLCNVLNMENEDHGWVPPETIPELKRRLIKVINGDVSEFTRPATQEGGKTFVDHSKEIPQIRKTATMIGSGVNDGQVRRGARDLLDIVDWAQKNGCGVSWA